MRFFDVPYGDGPEKLIHLLSLISPVAEDLAVVYLPLLPVGLWQLLQERGIGLVEVPPDEYDSLGPNVLAVRPRVVVMAAGNPVTAGRLRDAGVEVHEVPLDEVGCNGSGGPTCLTRPILARVSPMTVDASHCRRLHANREPRPRRPRGPPSVEFPKRSGPAPTCAERPPEDQQVVRRPGRDRATDRRAGLQGPADRRHDLKGDGSGESIRDARRSRRRDVQKCCVPAPALAQATTTADGGRGRPSRWLAMPLRGNGSHVGALPGLDVDPRWLPRIIDHLDVPVVEPADDATPGLAGDVGTRLHPSAASMVATRCPILDDRAVAYGTASGPSSIGPAASGRHGSHGVRGSTIPPVSDVPGDDSSGAVHRAPAVGDPVSSCRPEFERIA